MAGERAPELGGDSGDAGMRHAVARGLEAVGEALIVTAIIYLVPVHPLAFVIFQTISTAYNVYGHCGRVCLYRS